MPALEGGTAGDANGGAPGSNRGDEQRLHAECPAVDPSRDRCGHSPAPSGRGPVRSSTRRRL